MLTWEDLRDFFEINVSLYGETAEPSVATYFMLMLFLPRAESREPVKRTLH